MTTILVLLILVYYGVLTSLIFDIYRSCMGRSRTFPNETSKAINWNTSVSRSRR